MCCLYHTDLPIATGIFMVSAEPWLSYTLHEHLQCVLLHTAVTLGSLSLREAGAEQRVLLLEADCQLPPQKEGRVNS